MELSNELKAAIEKELNKVSHDELIKNSENLTDRYRNESGRGKHLVTLDSEAVTYSVVRMPATYGSVYKSLQYTLELLENAYISSFLDVGAGTGAASWAADALINLKEVTCLERENAMITLGSSLMKSSLGILNEAKWIKYDLSKDDYTGKADLVCASYVLNELSDEDRIKAVDKLWSYTDKILLIIEPGTKKGASNIQKIRKRLLENGASIIAPCPNENECAMEGEDWCHFSCRVSRSKLHKLIKKADVPYEDEKFSYIAVSRDKNIKRADLRVLRHPLIKKGRVQAQICTNEAIEVKEFFKRDGELYKKMKKADWGDSVDLQ